MGVSPLSIRTSQSASSLPTTSLSISSVPIIRNSFTLLVLHFLTKFFYLETWNILTLMPRITCFKELFNSLQLNTPLSISIWLSSRSACAMQSGIPLTFIQVGDPHRLLVQSISLSKNRSGPSCIGDGAYWGSGVASRAWVSSSVSSCTCITPVRQLPKLLSLCNHTSLATYYNRDT